METFEKKYNEALGWMRKVYPTLTGADKENAEHYFPELKEQPDPRNSIIEFIKWSCDRGSITPEQRKNVDFWLAYLERQKEQKPAEWSEEDEEMIDYIIHALSNNTCVKEEGPAIYAKEINWLKSLRPQPKQEWSEEDKKRVVELKTFIAKCNGFNKANRQKAFELIDELRPQPHWKPSKKQIDALNSIILTGSFTYVGQTQDLISLKDELKKL